MPSIFVSKTESEETDGAFCWQKLYSEVHISGGKAEYRLSELILCLRVKIKKKFQL